MSTEAIRVEQPTTNSKLFAHTRWDAVPTLAGLFHLGYFFGLYLLFPRTPLWMKATHRRLQARDIDVHHGPNLTRTQVECLSTATGTAVSLRQK